MMGEEQRLEILRLFRVEAWPVGTIARELGIHHSVVSRVLGREGLPRLRPQRPSMIDSHVHFIRETLDRHPTLQSRRLYDMCVERGYPGGPDHFRALVRRLRPKRPCEPYLRLRTLPGEEAQVDWGHFGHVAVGRARRQLLAFVMVLSWSRMIFVRFFLGGPMECFLRGHVSAFDFFAGIPRIVIYDNLKSAVLERRGDAVRFHPTILALAGHYGFEPRAAAVRRPTDKGKVERAIRFVRGSFFAARRWKDIDDLNQQAIEWCRTRAAARPRASDDVRSVGEAFEEEQGHLRRHDGDAFPVEHVTEAQVGKTPYVRFDGNDYSVPHGLVRSTVTIAASETRVRILEGKELVCEHERSYDKGAVVEQAEHVEELYELKRGARRGWVKDRLVRAAPSTAMLFEELARRGENLGAKVSALLRLLDEYGAERLEKAVREALDRETPDPRSVRLILERARLDAGLSSRVPVALPDDVRIRDLAVRPPSLAGYDALGEIHGQEPEEESHVE